MLYLHFCDHALDLILQEAAKVLNLIAEVLNFVLGVTVVVEKLYKRKILFESFFGSNEVVKNLFSFCPTRWKVRPPTIVRVLATFPILLEP